MPHSRTIGFPRESDSDERRTLLTPQLAHAFSGAGFRVISEPGIGAGIGQDDTALPQVEFCAPEQVWSAPLVLRYKPGPATDLDRLAPEQTIGAIFHAEGDPDMLTALTRTRVRAFSYEFLHERGTFPLATAGGQIAGTQAVLAGAQALQRPEGRGVLLGGVPGAAPAHAVVIGNGNVGAAAAHTAARLGAHVTVLTRTSHTATTHERRAPAGVRVETNTPERLAELVTTADLVIGAILISTHTTPAMITRDHLATMRPGAVIVDATCGYGNGYLPTAGPVQKPGAPPRMVNGVLHVKLDALPKAVPVTASHAYTHAAAPYLLRLARHVLHGADDPAVQSAMVARAGALVHPVLREHAERYTAGAVA
ncbi:alanine dehydrogenase [Lipingzhangella halophila]|uniref:Alanine dehydrogenase n=1 Tax=Lipingzhangella halophila TaxID=1783352 RepID=A0A7W7RLZ9_9ACTN|nr:NAD(P)-dependent oxidoreductase [Lipingzhangella halophila]MBB4934431.1 alanine dehydrogenase [Lipingzhangella halophila]MBB4934841.1 alanine dehydrogenase [Lipingzhangella halophila]